MVGTIEPRKGHLQTIKAFEQLWAKGVEINLVIVGGEGWKSVPDVQRRTIPLIIETLRNHPELGRRLFWLEGISDEYLEMVYGASTCLIASSEGEGFGLPLIEAAQHGLPILARDIPVFREVAGDHAIYFSGSQAMDIATAIEEWLDRNDAGNVPSTANMPWQTGAESAEKILTCIGAVAAFNGLH
jgi:glycosyltransferase involved in cell wall biosynthesis